MTIQDTATEDRVFAVPATTQGEAVATWALWSAVLMAMLVTYTRLDPTELYHVSRDGLTGGLSRTLVALNFPFALIAIALVLVAIDALPKRAWWIGAPAIVLCAVTAGPGVVDEKDLDARWINVLPAIGVALAAGLSIAAARRSRASVAGRLPLDPVRWIVTIVALVLSVPWILAELGVYGPEWVFIMERPITGSDGAVGPAVHLGHHHGFDGALLMVSVALLSRIRLGSQRLRTAATLYLSLVFGYGAVNFFQDAWNEQLVKRELVDRTIPNALNPALEPIWLVILAIAIATAIVLRAEARRVTDGPVGGVHSDTSLH